MSTKEFTYQEIEELNKEFNTANAFTKWKFMQTPEFKKLPDAVRYTVAVSYTHLTLPTTPYV